MYFSIYAKLCLFGCKLCNIILLCYLVIVLYCILMSYCIILFPIILYYSLLYILVLSNFVLDAVYCFVMVYYRMLSLLYCIIFYCTILCFIVLFCVVLLLCVEWYCVYTLLSSPAFAYFSIELFGILLSFNVFCSTILFYYFVLDCTVSYFFWATLIFGDNIGLYGYTSCNIFTLIVYLLSHFYIVTVYCVSFCTLLVW